MFIENYCEYALREWKRVMDWIPHANSVLSFFCECMNEWGFLIFILLLLLFFFFLEITFDFNCGVFLIGVQRAFNSYGLPAQAVLAPSYAVMIEGQPLQVSGKPYNSKTSAYH